MNASVRFRAGCSNLSDGDASHESRNRRKTAIVTGAARGIGAAIAERFVAEGASVVLVDVNNAEEQAKRLRRSGGRALALVANVLEQSSIDAMVSHASESFGGVDIPVNNAGFTRDMRIGRMTEPDWDAIVDVILKGSFLCTKAVSGLMTERGWCRIVNISSRAHLGNPGQANYSAAKAGLLGLTRALSLELGRFGVSSKIS